MPFEPPHKEPMTMTTIADTAAPVGTVLVRWLIAQDRHDEAVATAHRLGLLADEQLIHAWNTGVDPLQIAGLR